MIKKYIYLILTSAITCGCFASEYIGLGNYEVEDKRAFYSLPNVAFQFRDTSLQTVIDLLANATGINYQMDPMDLPKISTQVRMNPFKALEVMTERNGLSLSKHDAIWFISKKDAMKLIEKRYTLKNVHLGTYNQGLKTGHIHGDEKELLEGPGTEASGLMHEVETPTKNIHEEPKILCEIESMLQLGEGNHAYVSYNGDTNELFVVANEEQHRWVTHYLQTVDQDIPNIEMKIMFLSSSESPEKSFGVDWSGALSDGYQVSVAGADASGKETGIPWGTFGSLAFPTTAIVSSDIFKLKLKGLESNNTNETKKYPILTSQSNREVIINFTKNEPIISTISDTTVQTSSDNINAGTTNTIQVKQEEVGTVVKLLPRLIDGKKIALDIDIGVSNIIGFKRLNDNDYPIISQTRYQGQTNVEGGYTVIVGGLEETICDGVEHKVPFLNKIPFFGWLFKDIKKSGKKQKLSMYISVRLLNAKGEELEFDKAGIQSIAVSAALKRLNQKVKAVEEHLRS